MLPSSFKNINCLNSIIATNLNTKRDILLVTIKNRTSSKPNNRSGKQTQSTLDNTQVFTTTPQTAHHLHILNREKVCSIPAVLQTFTQVSTSMQEIKAANFQNVAMHIQIIVAPFPSPTFEIPFYLLVKSK